MKFKDETMRIFETAFNQMASEFESNFQDTLNTTINKAFEEKQAYTHKAIRKVLDAMTYFEKKLETVITKNNKIEIDVSNIGDEINKLNSDCDKVKTLENDINQNSAYFKKLSSKDILTEVESAINRIKELESLDCKEVEREMNQKVLWINAKIEESSNEINLLKQGPTLRPKNKSTNYSEEDDKDNNPSHVV